MEKRPTVAAYVTDRAVNALRVGDLMKLDILYYAFSTLKEGKPGLYRLKNVELLASLRKINPKLKVVVSIGGWGAGGFSEAAMTKEGRALFTSSAMAYIRAYDFDGIDMDWEYPCSSAAKIASAPEDKQNFTYLLENLRESLDEYGQSVGRSMHLSAAVGAGASCVKGMEADKVGQILDCVNLMTYDMRGGYGPSGHHTNLFPQTGSESGMCADKCVKLYHEAGVPIEKMVLGAAFYGRVWLQTPGFNQKSKGASTMDFTRIDRNCLTIDNPLGYRRYWDVQARAPYLYNGTDFISYDDEESIAHKCRYVAENGLAGIMFWEYGCDRTYRLLDAMMNTANWNGTR